MQIYKRSKIVIVPPPQLGGGPSNAITRVTNQLEKVGIDVTHNIISTWNTALLNVGTGIRFDILRLVRLRRRVVYRVDGCYDKMIFSKQGREWSVNYDKINEKIKIALKTADHVIYQSTFSKNLLDGLHKRSSDSFSTIPNGINLEMFSSQSLDAKGSPTIGCIGTFRSNRIKTIVDIIRDLQVPHRLLLVGRMDEQCLSDLRQFSLVDRQYCQIEHVPHVIGDKELVPYYQQIDCFLHPVIGDTCSNAVTEALACGVPVILPAWSGSSELIGEGGIIIRQEPWADYATFVEEYRSAIMAILNNQKVYSEKARQRAVAAFNIVDIANAYRRALAI